jgi:hypothetical protein
MKKCLAGALVAAATTMAAGDAWGDEVIGTRFEIAERTHSALVRLDRGHATIIVTRTVENAGPKSDQALFGIDIPQGAVATRLRTAGVNARGETTWFEGELMEAEEAARKYKELTGIGGYYPKDPALLSWRTQTHLALQVFPVTARSQKTVEYTLRMPASYENGAYVLKLPALGTETLPAKVRVVAEHEGDRIVANGVEIAPSATVSAANEILLKLEPRVVSPIDGALASFEFAAKRNLVHARIAAAPKLSQTPMGASVVVLVDTSRSVENVLDSELAAARAYLSQFPGANVELMTFDRKVHSPFGGALPVKEALSRLYALVPQAANGSQVDDALARADAALARAPAGAARRILLITDLRTRESLGAERFGVRSLSSGAILHIATLTDGAASLTRDDESPWATLPRKTGGLFWHATAMAQLDGPGRAVFEELVRPKRVDKLVVKGLPAEFTTEDTLDEGAGIEYLGLADAGSPSVSLEGELWSRPVKWRSAASADEAKRWAALVFGTTRISDLDEKEQMTLAMHGRAVSPVTSYLAIEPGVRPSTEGLEHDTIGHGDGIGTGQGFGNGHGRLGGHHTTRVDRETFLKKELASALSYCKATGGATADVQTTLIEIVDLSVTLATPDARAQSCVVEQLWNVMLPSSFDDESAEWSVTS